MDLVLVALHFVGGMCVGGLAVLMVMRLYIATHRQSCKSRDCHLR